MLATEATPVEVCHRLRGARPARRARARGSSPRRTCRSRSAARSRASPPSPCRRTCRYALDADVADEVYVGTTLATDGRADARRRSTGPGGCSRSPASRRGGSDRPGAFDLAVLAVSAQLLGAGERVLADSVAYVKQRKQFGREIGSLPGDQARAGRRPDRARLRPAAGLRRRPRRDLASARPRSPRGDAAYLASRTGLQVHGAIGYTAELDLSLWLTKIRALVTAWGTPAFHRARLLRGAGRLMEFAFSEEQQELAATVRSLLAKRADAPPSGPRWRPRPGTTRRCGRRSASRSAWPRSASRRSTTAPGSRCSSRWSCSRRSAARWRPLPCCPRW